MRNGESHVKKYTQPKVSCLMVTANRKHLIRRSVRCFRHQTYDQKELIIIDDGKQDLCDILNVLPSSELKYIKLEKKPENTLGKLRNRSLEEADGDFLVQWDDDDWYHPHRIAVQVKTLVKGYDACCLSTALMHLNEEPFVSRPFLGHLPEGIPGSIMHRSDAKIRYPHQRKAEDTAYLKKWREKKYYQLPERYAHLLIRCYHGANTWGKNHFLRRLRNNPTAACKYIWYKQVKDNLFGHPKFELNEAEKEAFELYVEDSRAVNLLPE